MLKYIKSFFVTTVDGLVADLDKLSQKLLVHADKHTSLHSELHDAADAVIEKAEAAEQKLRDAADAAAAEALRATAVAKRVLALIV